MQSAPLDISGIGKSYAGVPVLQDISFSLKPDEIFGLIGLNGAGKTTLIKIILDLTRPDSGAVSLFDWQSNDIRARYNLSYLPEKFQPSRYLKGTEYLDLTLSYYGGKLDVARAEALAEALDLKPEVLKNRVGSYSKGMGQKLGLVGAFLPDTSLLILDEPMSGLDPLARIRLKQQLLKEKQAGRTIFFSSHILADIEEICDRIGVIHNGVLHYVGTPQDFKKSRSELSLEQAFLESIAA
ncbi:MAG: ABC transporter ATP-binding protein [Alphaproteobacteria bacterium]